MNEKDDTLPEEVREAMLESVEPQFPASPRAQQAIKRRLMQRVAGARAVGEPATAAQPPGLLTVRANEGQWKAFLPRVGIKVLRREQDILTYLLRLEPGAALPPHDHPHDEECIVLEGEARIGELVVRAGDYHCARAGSPHGVIRSEHGAVLFLRGAAPAANQVRWRNLDALCALAPERVRKFIDRW